MCRSYNFIHIWSHSDWYYQKHGTMLTKIRSLVIYSDKYVPPFVSDKFQIPLFVIDKGNSM